MNIFIQMLAGTPLWVWGAFALVVVLGVRALLPTQASLTRLAILPIIFLVWGLQTAVSKLAASPVGGLSWLIALGAGMAVGLVLTAASRVTVDRESGILSIPGSAITLVVSLLIFCCKYGFGYTAAHWPALGQDPALVIASLATAGLFTGILVGRFAGLVLIYLSTRSKPATIAAA